MTRRGYTMARRSVYELSKRWMPAHTFPVQDVVLNDAGVYKQEFKGGTHSLDPNGDFSAVGRGPAIDFKKSPFKDVPTSHSHYGPIFIGAAEGIARGWPDGTYRPDAPVLRDAFAAFCYRVAGSPAYTPPRTSPFKDVPTTLAFYKEICWLHHRGISRGWPDGTFRPLSPIKRDAIAAMLYRMAPKSAFNFVLPNDTGFVDVTQSTTFSAEIAWMKSTGISQGWVKNESRPISEWVYEYRPLARATRADAVTFMIRWRSLFGPF